MRFSLYATALISALFLVENSYALNLNADPPAADADKKDDAKDATSACRDCCPKVVCGKCPCDKDKKLSERVMEAASAACGDCVACKKIQPDPTEKCTNCAAPEKKEAAAPPA